MEHGADRGSIPPRSTKPTSGKLQYLKFQKMSVLKDLVEEKVAETASLSDQAIALEGKIDALDIEIKDLVQALDSKRAERKQLASECLEITAKVAG